MDGWGGRRPSLPLIAGERRTQVRTIEIPMRFPSAVLAALIATAGLAPQAAADTDTSLTGGAGVGLAWDGGYVSATVDVHGGARVAERWWWLVRAGYGEYGELTFESGPAVLGSSAIEV